MLSYCLKCKKNTENVDSKVLKTKNRTMFLSNCAVYSSEIKIYERTRSKMNIK